MAATEDRQDRLRALASELDRAERDRAGVTPFARRAGPLDEADAWEIAKLRDQLRIQRGAAVTGYKLGWTSAAMRQALGIEIPNFGALFDYMRVDDGVLAMQRLIHPRAEPEFAFLADHELGGPSVGEGEVLASGRWAVAVEVVDPRWESYDFTWLDNTADGSSAAAYVVGPFSRASVPVGELRLEMESEGVRAQGLGAAALGSPAAAVSFLVAELDRRGETLAAGMVVLTGGITAPVTLRPGMTVHVSSPDLGGCTLRCPSA